MAGVPVTARRAISTVAVTAITDDKGRYSFPADRLVPGTYSLTIRAIGYDLDGKPAANVRAGETVTADIKLNKTRNLVAQLTSAEWLASWPGTDPDTPPVSDTLHSPPLPRTPPPPPPATQPPP